MYGYDNSTRGRHVITMADTNHAQSSHTRNDRPRVSDGPVGMCTAVSTVGTLTMLCIVLSAPSFGFHSVPPSPMDDKFPSRRTEKERNRIISFSPFVESNYRFNVRPRRNGLSRRVDDTNQPTKRVLSRLRSPRKSKRIQGRSEPFTDTTTDRNARRPRNIDRYSIIEVARKK